MNYPSNPVIAILDMSPPDFRIGESEHFGTFSQCLKESCNVRKCESPTQLYEALTVPPQPQAIFVFEADVIIKKKHDHLADVLVDYARTGGRVIFGGRCPNGTTPPKLSAFFKNKFGLPWTSGNYHRTTQYLNRSHPGLVTAPMLEESYSMKAIHVANIEDGDAVYAPAPESRIESQVFDPEPVALSEAPVAMREIGEGWVGWAGDVNYEKGTSLVQLSMLGITITGRQRKIILETPDQS